MIVQSYTRPAAVINAIENNDVICYFGVGSNLSRQKVANRGVNGTKIQFHSFKPAVVRNHRLAFNLRGLPPLEPSMGGIEPCESHDCHGSLIEMSGKEYQKLWLSEGGGTATPSYEEIMVDAIPYNSTKSIKAVSLRAAPHVRLQKDAMPSARYLSLILEGAEELQLDKEYISNLRTLKPAKIPSITRFLATKQYFFIGILFRKKLLNVFRIYSKYLWMFYHDSIQETKFSMIKNRISIMAITLALIPGALMGSIIEFYYICMKQDPPGLFGRSISAKKAR